MNIQTFLFRNITTSQTVVKNTFWLFSGRIANRLVRALLLLVAARILGAEGFGVFAFVLGLGTLFLTFWDFGITALIVRETKNEMGLGAFLPTAFGLRLILLALGFLTLLAVAALISPFPNVFPTALFVGLALFFDGLRELASATLRARQKMELPTIIEVPAALITTLVGFGVLAAFATPASLGFAYFSGSIAGFAGMFFFTKHLFFAIPKGFSIPLLGSIARAAWPLAFLGGTTFLFQNLEVIMLGWWKDAETVGLYAAAVRPMQLVLFLPSAVSMSLFAAITHLKETRRSEKLMRDALAAINVILVPVVIGGFLLAPQIIGLLYGAEYAGAASIFHIAIFILLAGSVRILLSTLFAVTPYPRILWSFGAAILLNIALNVLLIPPFSGSGAALASLSAQSALALILFFFSPQHLFFSYLRNIWRPVLAGGLMGMVVAPAAAFGLQLWLSVPLGAVIYFIALLLLREPFLKEIRRFLKIPAVTRTS